MQNIEKYLYNLILLNNIQLPLNEKGITYYELRQFITVMFNKVKDDETKKVLSEILKTLMIMELRNLPIPHIRKIKTDSPEIFPDNNDK